MIGRGREVGEGDDETRGRGDERKSWGEEEKGKKMRRRRGREEII